MDTETPHFAVPETTTATSVDLEPAQWRKTLLDLPTELIFLIARYIGHVDLLSLAVLCRRLHHIALPLYFKRKGVHDIQGNLRVAFTNGYLPGLRMALFLDSAREMEFTFCNSPQLLQHMREAAHLISRFTRLGHVRLDFRNLTFQRSSTSSWVTNTGHDMIALIPPTRSLFDAIHARPRTSFAVCHGRIEMDPGQSFSLAQEMETPHSVITSLVRRAKRGQNEPGWESPEFPSPPLRFLQTFHFQSNLLLWQPLLNWTFQTFERSSRSLVKLSFRHLCLKTSDWAYLLPQISLPFLAELILSTNNINFSDLTLFLRRHPRITSLCLCGGRLRSRDDGPEPLPAGLLPGLTKLCGPVDYILQLLQNGRQFPRLAEVDIRPVTQGNQAPERLARQNAALALVAKFVPASKRIRIVITLFQEILCAHPPVPDPAEDEPPRSLLNVSSMKLLRVDAGFTIHRIPARVSRWLALFPALRDVTFSQDFFPSVYRETKKCAFVAQVLAACPNMEYVAIGKDRRSVVTWQESSNLNA